jgi:hypothetical protein
MQLMRDLLDQGLRDPHGELVGRADDFSIVVDGDGIFLDAILCGGGILADDLGVIGRVCERACHVVHRRPLRRASIPWAAVSEVAEHALTVSSASARKTLVAGSRAHTRLRRVRRLPVVTGDGDRLHLVDLQVVDPRPRARLRVDGLIVRPRNRIAWPVSLRPRQRGASSDWRFVPGANVRLTPDGLVVDRSVDTLAPVRESSASHPPRRMPRTNP